MFTFLASVNQAPGGQRRLVDYTSTWPVPLQARPTGPLPCSPPRRLLEAWTSSCTGTVAAAHTAPVPHWGACRTGTRDSLSTVHLQPHRNDTAGNTGTTSPRPPVPLQSAGTSRRCSHCQAPPQGSQLDRPDAQDAAAQGSPTDRSPCKHAHVWVETHVTCERKNALHVRNRVHHATTHAQYERNMHVACGRKHESHGGSVCAVHVQNVSCERRVVYGRNTRHRRKMHVSSGGVPALCEREHAWGLRAVSSSTGQSWWSALLPGSLPRNESQLQEDQASAQKPPV